MKTKTLAVITGAKGFIGSNLARDLVKQDMHVVLTDLTNVSDFRIRDILANDKVYFFPSNLTVCFSMSEFVKKLKAVVDRCGFEEIEFYHTAAYFSFNPHTSYEVYHQINVEGTERIIRHMSASSLREITRMIVWSSATVHGKAEKLATLINNAGGCNMSNKVGSLLKEDPYLKESDPCLPTGPYELSKYVEECISLKAGKDYGLKVCVGRPTGVYGPWSTYAAANAIFMIARGELKGIPGPGTSYASLVHVQDVIRAFQHIVRYSNPYEIYEVADDGKYTVSQMFTHVAQEINKWRTIRHEPPIQFNPNFHLPIPVVLLAAQWLKFTSRFTGLQPKIEKDLIELFFRSARFSSEKLLEIGFHFKYPDTLEGITATIDWYAEKGWI